MQSSMLQHAPLLPIIKFSGISALGQYWTWRADDENVIYEMRKFLDMPEPLARVLAGRGIEASGAEDFLTPTLRNLLPNPFELKDMAKAVARIVAAIEQGEQIYIFGDYDVDGATSTALLVRYFKSLGVEAGYYIPDRMKEGYGPNATALIELKKRGADLVITVDCGAVAFSALEAAKNAELDVIVMDHHKGAAELPYAVAVVNPNRLDEHSENTHLAAVGVCFLLIVALNKTLREAGFFTRQKISEPNLMQLLDLVALGTICDVVSLTTINRAFAKQGLKIMENRGNAGIKALLEVAKIEERELSAYHAGFILGPRINAGGRVGESSLGVRLLTSDNDLEIAEIAARLNEHNLERQAIEAMVLEQAMNAAQSQHNHDVIMVAGVGWHEGVIGIIASRIKDRFNRPSIVASINGAKGKASARSVSGVDIGASIVSAREHGIIIEGGGHMMAGGFSFEAERLLETHQFFVSHMQEGVGKYLQTRTLKLDAPITCAMVNGELSAMLDKASPYGMGNPSPTLVICGVSVESIEILKEQHLRLIVSDGSARLKAMCFRCVGSSLGDFLHEARGKKIHICGNLSNNNWQGQRRTEFIINDAMEI